MIQKFHSLGNPRCVQYNRIGRYWEPPEQRQQPQRRLSWVDGALAVTALLTALGFALVNL